MIASIMAFGAACEAKAKLISKMTQLENEVMRMHVKSLYKEPQTIQEYELEMAAYRQGRKDGIAEALTATLEELTSEPSGYALLTLNRIKQRLGTVNE